MSGLTRAAFRNVATTDNARQKWVHLPPKMMGLMKVVGDIAGICGAKRVGAGLEFEN
jgi:hypothetical protein